MTDGWWFVISFCLGMVALALIYYALNGLVQTPPIVLDDPTNDPDYINRFRDTPHCPDCGSFDLKLVDIYAGIGWLKGHAPEIDYYECQRCHRVFTDENWQDAKKVAPSE